jgi:hypothetical protein
MKGKRERPKWIPNQKHMLCGLFVLVAKICHKQQLLSTCTIHRNPFESCKAQRQSLYQVVNSQNDCFHFHAWTSTQSSRNCASDGKKPKSDHKTFISLSLPLTRSPIQFLSARSNSTIQPQHTVDDDQAVQWPIYLNKFAWKLTNITINKCKFVKFLCYFNFALFANCIISTLFTDINHNQTFVWVCICINVCMCVQRFG